MLPSKRHHLPSMTRKDLEQTLETVYTFVRDYVAEHGYAPSLREISSPLLYGTLHDHSLSGSPGSPGTHPARTRPSAEYCYPYSRSRGDSKIWTKGRTDVHHS